MGPFDGLELQPNVSLAFVASFVVHHMDDPASLRRQTILLLVSSV